MNIGILFPRSKAYPLIGSDFLEGIKAFTANASLGEDVKFFPESIGFGGVEKEVYAKAEKLLMIDDVDILVGFIDERILELLKPLLLASAKLFILVNAGANQPANWVPQPNIITLSLRHSFLCALNGQAAASAENKTAAVVSTFYDCGYLHLATVVREFVAAKGKVQFNYINNQLYDDNFNINELISFLDSDKNTKTLLCVLDSLPASLFYKLLNQYEEAHHLNLYVSPMMIEKKALENLNNGFNFSVHGYLPWHLSDTREENLQFINHYQKHLKKAPGIFSLLGWEAGMILKEISNNNGGNYRNGELLTEVLKTKKISGPRGTLQLDASTQFYICPAIRCSIPAGSAEMEMEYNLDFKNEWEAFTEKNTEGPVSGWTNTYLCY